MHPQTIQDACKLEADAIQEQRQDFHQDKAATDSNDLA
jgi:hypothetical protein